MRILELSENRKVEFRFVWDSMVKSSVLKGGGVRRGVLHSMGRGISPDTWGHVVHGVQDMAPRRAYVRRNAGNDNVELEVSQVMVDNFGGASDSCRIPSRFSSIVSSHDGPS
ncbi:hypothetical protein MTR67_001756 [Solanum verrucosum]|uniref:Uncharacterized protein n=1 Tax=Solanum verrucosum TaxID=315347 RepID=A0AAF0PPS8_SOLVR|nr:hypothetical protein MTR67_001756 [Solanum verrucosum]